MVYLAFVCGVWLGIALFVDLFQGNLRRGVELELEDIYIVGAFQHAVDAPLARLLLHIGVVLAEQLQDEVEGVLEMTLTLPRVLLALEAVGDVGEETRQLELELLKVATAQGTGDVNKPRVGIVLVAEIVRRKQRNHTAAHFLVGEVETIHIECLVITLYGQVAALVEHGQRLLSRCLVIYKFSGRIFLACQFVDVLVVV